MDYGQESKEFLEEEEEKKRKEAGSCLLSRRHPGHCQRRDLGERRRHGAGHRRRPAHGARRVVAEPRVDALPVEQVAALGQLPEHLAVAVVVEADGAARARGALLAGGLGLLLGLAVHHLRIPFERGLVDAELDVVVRAFATTGSAAPAAAVAPPGRRSSLPRRRVDGRSGAEVGGERDGGDEQEDADGDADAVAEAADAVGAEHAAGAAVHRCQPHGRRPAGAHRGVPSLPARRRAKWPRTTRLARGEASALVLVQTAIRGAPLLWIVWCGFVWV